MNMSKICIEFDKDKELEDYVGRVGDIMDIYGSVNVRINDIYLPHINNLCVFISYFYVHCLTSLPKLFSGDSSEFGLFEEPFKLILEPEKAKVLLHIDEECKLPGDKFEVEFENFANEIFRSVDEYFDYVLELRPDFVYDERTREFQDKIEEFRNWYDHPASKKV